MDKASPQKSLSELIVEVRSRYWKQRVGNFERKDLVPVVKAVLDDNGMANDPAYYETVSEICSILASRNNLQLSLFP